MSKLKCIIYFFATIYISLFLLISRSFAESDLEKGRSVYEAHCISCHGIAGDGNGPAAVSLIPKPTNFTDSAVMSQITFADIERAIVQGKHGTKMEGFGNILNNEEVRNVITYIKSLIKE